MNGENYLSNFFFSFKVFGCKFWGFLKKGYNFGYRVLKYANMWGGGGARGQKLLQFHSYCILLYLKQLFPNPLSLFHTFKVATDLRIRNFTVLRTVTRFVLIFREFLALKMQ